MCDPKRFEKEKNIQNAIIYNLKEEWLGIKCSNTLNIIQDEGILIFLDITCMLIFLILLLFNRNRQYTSQIYCRQMEWEKSISLAGGVAQVVDCLPSKCKAPSSKPSTAKIKKIKKKDCTIGMCW
jgi:hypothetical protein